MRTNYAATWTITYCLPQSTFSESWNQEWSQDLYPDTLICDMGVPHTILINLCAVNLPHFRHFSSKLYKDLKVPSQFTVSLKKICLGRGICNVLIRCKGRAFRSSETWTPMKGLWPYSMRPHAGLSVNPGKNAGKSVPGRGNSMRVVTSMKQQRVLRESKL